VKRDVQTNETPDSRWPLKGQKMTYFLIVIICLVVGCGWTMTWFYLGKFFARKDIMNRGGFVYGCELYRLIIVPRKNGKNSLRL